MKLKQKSLQKLKEFSTYNSNSKKKFIKFNPSMKNLEDSVSLNSINQNLTKIKIDNDKSKNQNIKNNNFSQYSKSNRYSKNIFTYPF